MNRSTIKVIFFVALVLMFFVGAALRKSYEENLPVKTNLSSEEPPAFVYRITVFGFSGRQVYYSDEEPNYFGYPTTGSICGFTDNSSGVWVKCKWDIIEAIPWGLTRKEKTDEGLPD